MAGFDATYHPQNSPPAMVLSSDEDELGPFRPLMRAIDFDALILVATETRLHQASIAQGDGALRSQISCEIDHNPMVGAYNLIYKITFSDNVRWIARFPGNGVSSFTDLDRQQMYSDYHTMRLIRSTTSIPIPEVFSFETTTNSVGAPYALMSFIQGVSVSKRWFDESWVTENRRETILRGLAKHMSSLHTLRFDRIGSLTFNESGQFTHVGPQFDHEFTDDDRSEHQGEDASELANASDAVLESSSESDGADDANWPSLSTSGPFRNVKDYLLDSWDDLEGCADWMKAELAVVRLAVESIPERLIKHDNFSPSPPDLDSQNVFVDDDANITGIIDWDCTQTQCPIAGFARYPSWITRDWDPCMYAFGEAGAVQDENSPGELSTYRQTYAAAFANASLPASCYSPDDTRLSHIFEAIDIAANTRLSRHGIVPKLLDHAFGTKLPFSWPEFCDEFLAGNANTWLKQIEAAFGDMWTD